MTNSGGGGQYGIQARGAAEGQAGGPSMTPGRGPTDRRDVLIAVIVVVALAALVVYFVAR